MSKNTEQTPEQTVASNSRKRDLTATATSMAVTIALGIAANALIGKVATQVHDRIAPKPKTESTN